MHFLRNAAYYHSWVTASVDRRREQYWITVNGNFMDICVLEWCKLFGDRRAEHYWAKSIMDVERFTVGLSDRLNLTGEEFETYRLELRAYRDKFVAHLDEQNTAVVPRLRKAVESVQYLYDYLVSVEDDVEAFHDAPRNANARYRIHLREGRIAHAS